MLSKFFNRKRRKSDPYRELNAELVKIGSSIRVSHRKVTARNRMCQVYVDYIDFWENGMKWLGVQGLTTKEQAELLHCWNELRLNSTEIEERVPGIRFPISRKKIEAGEEAFLEWYWGNLRRSADNRFGELIELFAGHERTRKLFSYHHIRDFGLSRSIGQVNGAYWNDLPCIRITDEWEYEVRTPKMAILEYSGNGPRKYLGRGNAREAFEMVLSYLPPNVGMAHYQRVEDWHPPAA